MTLAPDGRIFVAEQGGRRRAPQIVGGHIYVFASWSDGSALRIHVSAAGADGQRIQAGRKIILKR